MTFFSRLLRNALLRPLLLLPLMVIASPKDHHDHHSEQQTQGQNGGHLLKQGDFSLEISIFETGVPAEMRVYSYYAQKQLPAEQVELQVILSRLGGEQNVLQFTPEADYLLSNTVIAEPHSYSVTVNARYQDHSYSWQYDSFEGRVELNERVIKLSGIKSEPATSRVLTLKRHLFGVISADPTRQFNLKSPYPAIVQRVLVVAGQQVKKDDVLLELTNTNTLQTFTVKAPAHGEITKRSVNAGQVVTNETLLELVDFSRVHVELSAFPSDMQQIRLGQPVEVFNLHHTDSAQSNISYIAPAMTDGHIARVRTEIDNTAGFWRPGMHIKADVLIGKQEVTLAVRKEAIQQFRDKSVVFARFGNQFEVRMLQLGLQDDHYIEVVSGLTAGTEYVTENSYLLKADVEKDGASHQH